jgi:hypothetical protein
VASALIQRLARSRDKRLHLFPSSPGDCQEERNRVRDIVDRINASEAARERKIKIKLVRWEDLPPGEAEPGNLQVRIDDQPVFEPERADFLSRTAPKDEFWEAGSFSQKWHCLAAICCGEYTCEGRVHWRSRWKPCRLRGRTYGKLDGDRLLLDTFGRTRPASLRECVAYQNRLSEVVPVV